MFVNNSTGFLKGLRIAFTHGSTESLNVLVWRQYLWKNFLHKGVSNLRLVCRLACSSTDDEATAVSATAHDDVVPGRTAMTPGSRATGRVTDVERTCFRYLERRYSVTSPRDVAVVKGTAKVCLIADLWLSSIAFRFRFSLTTTLRCSKSGTKWHFNHHKNRNIECT